MPIRNINENINKNVISLRKKQINEIFTKKRTTKNLNIIQNNNDQYLFKIENLQISDDIRKLYLVDIDETMVY